MEVIKSENYRQVMQRQVEPYLEEHRSRGTFEAVSGRKIYYEQYSAQEPRAVIIMVHGFTEGVYKFREIVYYFLKNGYRVWQIEQRGHGKSYRSADDPCLVHIEDYQDLLGDLHYFVNEIVKPAEQSSGLPLYLYAHSMGGGLGACYLERYPEDFEKAVLSSPMLELDSGNIPVWAMCAFAKLLIAVGKGDSYLPGSAPYREEPDFANSCCDSLPRYSYFHDFTNRHKEYQTSISSIQTALQFLRLTREAVNEKNCGKVKAEVLLFQAGNDTMVKPGGQDRFIKQIGDRGRLVRFAQSKHEIYLGEDAQLEDYLGQILAFLR